MKVVLPDHLYDQASVLGARLGVDPETVLKAQLQKWGTLNPTKRIILLDDALCALLEDKLGQVTDGKHLVAKVERLGNLSLMGKDLRLSTNQLSELARRAERQGTTVERLMLAVWDAFAPSFFDNAMGTTVIDRGLPEAVVVPITPAPTPVNGTANAKA